LRFAASFCRSGALIVGIATRPGPVWASAAAAFPERFVAAASFLKLRDAQPLMVLEQRLAAARTSAG